MIFTTSKNSNSKTKFFCKFLSNIFGALYISRGTKSIAKLVNIFEYEGHRKVVIFSQKEKEMELQILEIKKNNWERKNKIFLNSIKFDEKIKVERYFKIFKLKNNLNLLFIKQLNCGNTNKLDEDLKEYILIEEKNENISFYLNNKKIGQIKVGSNNGI